ncbi:MAG: cation:proton antiporter [Bradymonadia bacterium]
MDAFDTVSILLVVAGLFGYLNHHFLKLPFTIGLMVSGLLASLLVVAIDAMAPGLGWGQAISEAVLGIDFTDSVLRVMLGALLFAGAMHVNLDDLLDQKGIILTLASVGVILSTVVFGGMAYYIFAALGHPISLPWCMVFGSLLAPTDPIAVLGIMKSLGAPKALESKVAGESLFNDGVGVVVFAALVSWASSSTGDVPWGDVGVLFLEEVGGGVVLGLGAGLLVYKAMRTLDEPNLEILLSVGLVMGMTTVAYALHFSAPLACVFAGLLIGNHGRRLAMSAKTREALDLVWAFIDEALNAILFLLVGLEVFQTQSSMLVPALVAIPMALLARAVAVSVPVKALSLGRDFLPGTTPILIWGGLKGGISVALALSLPQFEGRGIIIAATYVVVVFSILVQGMTVGPLIKRLTSTDPSQASHH